MVENTIVFPIIRQDLMRTALETLYRYTESNFRVIVIDQSPNGIEKDIIDKYIHLYIRPYRNLGFAKATNVGFRLADTKYVTTCNDDVEFIGDWFDGIVKTFDKVDKATPERPCVMVNPSSVKLPDWSVGKPKGEDHYILPYKQFYSHEDYEYLLNEPHYVNEHLTIMPETVIDGVACYCSVFKKEHLDKIGYFDERYYPGSGQDYDFACRANMLGYRSVGTTLSYVFHHWSKSFTSVQEQEEIRALIDPERCWNNLGEAWGEGRHSLWGAKCSVCQEEMRVIKGTNFATCSKKHERYKIPEVVKVPL